MKKKLLIVISIIFSAFALVGCEEADQVGGVVREEIKMMNIKQEDFTSPSLESQEVETKKSNVNESIDFDDLSSQFE